jgi:hypothetical protein
MMNQPWRAAVALALLAALLNPVKPAAAAQRKSAKGETSSPGAAAGKQERSRALPAPVWNRGRDEQWAYRKLAQPTTVEFLDLPLEDGMTFLKEYHNFPMRFDEAALKTTKISIDTPVTLKLAQVPLQRILNVLLNPHKLDWHIEGPNLVITTPEENAAAIRRHLDKRLEPEVAIVDHVCELTGAQRQKLELAGRGAIQRLVEGVEERQIKLRLVMDDEKQATRLFDEIEELQRSIESGPFGKGTVFRKSLETTLTAQQMTRYDPIRTVIQAGGLVGTLERRGDVVLGILLIGTTFADEGLAKLKGFSALKFLRLDGTKVTDAGLAHLQGLTNLQDLYVGGTQVTDAGLVHLKGMAKLQTLSLYGTQVTDSGLKHLAGLANLRELELAGTQVTDEGLKYLTGLKNLQSLDLNKTKTTAAGVDKLQNTLPELKISR